MLPWPIRALAGEAGGPRIAAVHIGVGGQYKVGFWTPVHVTLMGGERACRGRLTLAAEDGDGAPAEFIALEKEPFPIPARAAVALWRYVKFGRLRGAMTVTLETDEGAGVRKSVEVVRRQPALLSTQEWVVTVGPTIGMEEAVRLPRRRAIESFTTSRVAESSDLPNHWCGYEGVRHAGPEHQCRARAGGFQQGAVRRVGGLGAYGRQADSLRRPARCGGLGQRQPLPAIRPWPVCSRRPAALRHRPRELHRGLRAAEVLAGERGGRRGLRDHGARPGARPRGSFRTDPWLRRAPGDRAIPLRIRASVVRGVRPGPTSLVGLVRPPSVGRHDVARSAGDVGRSRPEWSCGPGRSLGLRRFGGPVARRAGPV